MFAALIFYVIGISLCAGLLHQLYGLTIVVAIFAFGILTAVLLVVFSGVVVEPRVRKLIHYRPWLIGRVHGTFSSAFTTIWHRDVGIQLVSHDLSRHVNKSGYVMRANRKPFAIVPSICFFEEDWHHVLDTLELKQPGFLHLNPPPDMVHICTLLIDRLSFLDTRLRGYQWNWTEGGLSWLCAIILTVLFWNFLFVDSPIWLQVISIPLLVLVFYLFRISLWTLHTKRQFANERRGYLALASEVTKRSVNWFTDDTLFWSDGLMWIQMPVRYVTRIRIEFSVIEFCAPGIEFRFHREGFQNHEAWLAASDVARRMMERLRAG
jgi:cbb3-type cytochrome oxidase subunit 3